MRAIRCHHAGPPEELVLEDLPPPPLGAGQVRVKVLAAGVNFADTLMIQGKYQERPAFPFIPGGELAGEVLEVGEGVRGWVPGTRVMGLGAGAFCTEAVVDAGALMPLPDPLDPVEAAAFPVAYGTSHLALTDRARLQAGETVLVLGAAGGVGLTAVEVAKALGARVIAAASSAEKLALAKSYGADEGVNYGEGDLRTQVKALAPKGVDVVIDPVGGDLAEAALRCLGWAGRHVVVGFASGTIPSFAANLLLVKNIAVTGIFWGNYRFNDPGTLMRSLGELLGMWAGGRLRPPVGHRFPLERTPEALRLLMDRQALGKVVITMP